MMAWTRKGTIKNKVRAWSVLAVSLATLITLLVTYWLTGQKNQILLYQLSLLFFSVVIIEKVTDVFGAYASDSDMDDRKREAELNRTTILGMHDITYFPTSAEGYRHCSHLAERASYIRNTVLRYGELETTRFTNEAYQDWLNAKRDAVTRGRTVREIVSTHLKAADLERQFIRDLKDYSNYRPFTLDDKVCPMMQMTIFRFENHSEVVFGWEFPDQEDGPCFTSRNVELVAYFQRQFEYFCSKKSSRELNWADEAVGQSG